MYLYFVQAGDEGPIKIGIAVEPEKRIVELQLGSPVELVLLAAVPATVEMERELHARFAAGRLRGEWFDPATPGLQEAISEATYLEAEIAYARRMCVHCGVKPVMPPRTKVCSEACYTARKRQITADWNRRRSPQT